MKNNNINSKIIILKNEKGISLMVLIITIIVLLIIAGTTIYFSTTSVETIIEKQDISTLNMIQEIVMAQYSKAQYLGETNRPVSNINQPSSYFGELVKGNTSELYYVTKMTNKEETELINNGWGGSGTDTLIKSWADYSAEFNSYTYDDCYYRIGPVELKELGIIDSTGTNETVHTYIVKYSTGEVYDETMHTPDYYIEGNKNTQVSVKDFESDTTNRIQEEVDFDDNNI